MCRYGDHTYKDHFACFGCRKTFRKPESLQYKCPDCGEVMVNMGKDFAAPRKRNHKQWAKVQLLAQNGILFRSCGCSGPGYRPKTMREAHEFLSQKTQTGRVWGQRKVLTKPGFMKKSR